MTDNTQISNIDAVILAGGLGTRLSSLILDQQKVIAEVNGKPFVIYVIEWLANQGIRTITLALGHRADKSEESISHWNNSLLQLELKFSKERILLGTGGAIRYSSSQTNSDPVLVMNGDSFSPVNLNRLLQLHLEKNATATLAITSVFDGSKYGVVTMDSSSQIIRFNEKSIVHHNDKYFINSGIYLVNRNLIESIPANKNISLEYEIFPKYVNNGMYGMIQDVPFLDIGTPDSFLMAENFLHNLSQ